MWLPKARRERLTESNAGHACGRAITNTVIRTHCVCAAGRILTVDRSLRARTDLESPASQVVQTFWNSDRNGCPSRRSPRYYGEAARCVSPPRDGPRDVQTRVVVIPFAVLSPIAAVAAGIAAFGVPLLIHLLFRKRYQIVPWAAMRFLLVAERRHRRRVDQWLLLSLRTLALLLPLLGMIAVTEAAEGLWQWIRPGRPQLVSNAPRTHHVLVVDASLSMTARTEEGLTRFELALERAESLIRNANPGDGFTLIALAASPETLVEGPSNEAEKVIAELRRLRVTHGPADAAAVLVEASDQPSESELVRTVGDVLGRSPRSYPRRQVTVFSDLQRATWARAVPIQQPSATVADQKLRESWRKLHEDDKAEIAIVDLARVDVENLALVDLALADPVPLTDTPIVVHATVQNFGRVERRRIAVELQMARPSASGVETMVRVDTIKTVDVLAPGGRASITFVLDGIHRFRERGIHILQAAFVKEHSNPADDLPADDSRALALEVREGLHVALVDGRPAVEPERRGSSYLSWALHPPGVPLTETPARLFRPGARLPDSPEDRWILSPTQLTHPTQGELTGADCVFLCDVPNPTPALVARLEAHLKRGGGVVIGLGPNAAASREAYNRLLYNDGKGLLPGELGDTVAVAPLPQLGSTAIATPGYFLSGDDEAFRRPPLSAFQSDNARAGLASVPFHGYVRIDVPTNGRARRILSFVPALELPEGTPPWARRFVQFSLGYSPGPPDAALVEWQWNRGRVLVYTSTFHPDIEWTRWPLLPTYLPFMHQLLRFAAANPDRHTIRVGDPIDDYFPAATLEKSVAIIGPDGLNATVPLVSQDEALIAHFPDTRLSGIYRLGVGMARDRAFAVNVADNSQLGASESDLSRIDPLEFKTLGPIQVVAHPQEVKLGGNGEASAIETKPRPWGSDIARIVVLLGLLILAIESVVAWLMGPARSPAVHSTLRPARRWGLWAIGTVIALVPLAIVSFTQTVVVHAEATGVLFGFLPESSRDAIRAGVGIPPGEPGEGIAWRLERITAFAHPGSLQRLGMPDGAGILDLWIVSAVGIGCALLTLVVYWMERRAAGGAARLIPTALLRIGAFALVLSVILPQLQLTFDREGWPEVVLLIDTSASMATEDEFRDPAVRARAEELARNGSFPRSQQPQGGAPFRPNRLELTQALLLQKDRDWLDRLSNQKRVKVAVYAVDRDTRRVASVLDPADVLSVRAPLQNLHPVGDQSRQGDGVEEVLRRHQGRSLAGIIFFTDGITTAGADLPNAARKAAQAGVSLHLIGTGDTWEAPDLGLSDLQAEDVVTRSDNLVFAVRLTARGQVPTEPVTVLLCEKRDNPNEEPQRAGDPGVLAQVTVAPDPSGNPVTVRLSHAPAATGEIVYVLKVPPVPEEVSTANNRIERSVLVTEARKTRLLYVEGRPRYDFRFVKVLLERESARLTGNKAFEFNVLLLGAAPDWPQTDRSALVSFPTREQLFEYDVLVLGDVDRAQIERHFANETDPRSRTANAIRDLADFVRVRGGGLLVLAGEHAGAGGFAETPLADVLPIIPTEAPPKPTPEDRPLTDSYRLRLTPAGARHPMFRLRPDEGESSQVWARLPKLYWSAKGYHRKPAAEVLAVHPERAAEVPSPSGRTENHPLALQQFVGNGRVVFLGFDDTWRWRYRTNEEYFDRFWLQGVRVLARSRIGRIELRTDKQTPYREGERLILTARFPDDAPPPPEGQVVRVRWMRSPLTGPGPLSGHGESGDDTLTLTRPQVPEGSRKPDDARTFQHVLTRTPVGEYRFVMIEPAVEGNRPRTEARVLPPPDERSRVDLNTSDLAAAATISGGRFYSLANAEAVFDELKNLDPVPLDQPRPPLTIWDHPATYALFFVLLLAEWLLRKRERLL